MLDYLAANLGTIIVAIAVAGIVAASVITMIRNKKKGKSSCGCGCESCAMKGQCHSHK